MEGRERCYQTKPLKTESALAFLLATARLWGIPVRRLAGEDRRLLSSRKKRLLDRYWVAPSKRDAAQADAAPTD